MQILRPPVVVTRPIAQAMPLAERLRAAGFEAVVFPLLDIEPLADSAALEACLSRLVSFDLVVFVSPNAIDAAMRFIQAWPREVAIGVVGEGSRRQLARYGVTPDTTRIFCPAYPARSDSDALLQLLDVDALRGRRVLIVRGESGREFLSDALKAAGVVVEQIPAYRRCAPKFDDPRREQLNGLLAQPVIWSITSSESMRILLEMTGFFGGEAALHALRLQRFFVPHHRIEETARHLGCHDVILTASGDEQLLAALQSRT